jgi:hypothetical protein
VIWPPKTFLLFVGAVLLVAALFVIVAGLRGGRRSAQTAAVSPTVAATAVARASTPAPTSIPTRAPRPVYTPLHQVAVRTFRPTPTPSPTASPKPTATPKPTPSPRATPKRTATPRPVGPRPAPAGTGSAVTLVGGPDDAACLRTLSYVKTAADDRIGRRAAYNAAAAGLAMNAHCGEPRRSVNEGYLLAMRAPAEFALRVGDWNADLTRSDVLLEACALAREFRGTTVASDCTTQRKFNDLTRRRIAQLSSRRATPAPR